MRIILEMIKDRYPKAQQRSLLEGMDQSFILVPSLQEDILIPSPELLVW